MKWAWVFGAVLAFPFGVAAFDGADLVFLGEVHDNAAHHVSQADLIKDIAPKALVFEMLTAEQAQAAQSVDRRDPDALAHAFDWAESGWPPFETYFPIFEAAPDATVFGAGVPRAEARRLMVEDVASVFGDDAAQFGLLTPLPDAEQKAREALQMAAHCDALPPDMLPMMVDIQRLRDAALARAALQAFEQTGGPVVVITGNGHARRDWGAPVAASLAAPHIRIWSVGQGETSFGAPAGVFDQIMIGPDVKRPDPCAAFGKS